MPNILTVSVRSENQLEVGAWYVIRGIKDGLPIPVQLFLLTQKHVRPGPGEKKFVRGELFWQMFGHRRHEPNHQIFLDQVNLPERGSDDVHLEKLPRSQVRAMLDREDWPDIDQDRHLRNMLNVGRRLGDNGKFKPR